MVSEIETIERSVEIMPGSILPKDTELSSRNPYITSDRNTVFDAEMEIDEKENLERIIFSAELL